LENSLGDAGFDSYGLIYAAIAVSCFHVIFPMEIVNKKIFDLKDLVTEELSYQDAKKEFFTTVRTRDFLMK